MANYTSRVFQSILTAFFENILRKKIVSTGFKITAQSISTETESIFSIKLRNFKLWKTPKQLNFRFPEG